MGNTQSASHHNRLSKPKTNTNSPHTTPKIDSPVSVTSKYADLSAANRQQLRAKLTSPVVTEFGTTASADGDDGLGELATHVQRRLSTLSRSNSVLSNRGGGRNSLGGLASLPGSKVSLVSNSQSVDLDTAIKILHEVRKTASPEDLAALHQALQSSSSPPSGSPIPEEGLRGRTSAVNRSSSSLIRRRSLIATPGLATRNSPTDGARKTWNSWKTRDLDAQDDPKWKKGDMVASSPLTRIATLDVTQDGRESPTPRAQTPGELAYSHLGSLQLGSLIVTNGAPSPAVSTRNVSRRKSAVDLSREEDYFTALDGISSETRRRDRSHSRSKSSIIPQHNLLHPDRAKPIRAHKIKTDAKCDSPLKLEDGQEHAPKPIKNPSTKRRSADMLAKDYMADIPNSPFGDFKVNGAMHDEGFADASPDELHTHIEGKTDSKENAQVSRKLSQCDRSSYTRLNCLAQEGEHEDDLEPPKPAERSSSQKGHARLSLERKRRGRPTPRKADSGYSSGGSFRVNHRESMERSRAPVVTEKPSTTAELLKSERTADGNDAASLYTFEQMLALTHKPLPAIPKDEGLSVPPAELEKLFSWYDEGKLLSTQEVEILPGRNSMESSLLSPRTVQSSASYCTTDSAASKRLQKRRPSVQELPVVQACQPILEGTIPSVPDTVRAKFVRRLSETPEMECLTRTYLSKDHVGAEEAVVDSPTAFTLELPSSFPSQSPSPAPRNSPLDDDNRPPTPPPHGTRRSRSLFRRKTASDEKQNAKEESESNAPTVLDLGTIANALGGSPYDIAMPDIPRKSVTSPTHPHQLGNAQPRAKSMVSMDARTAAEVARFRSKDRAQLRPPMPKRPSSYHEIKHERPMVGQQLQQHMQGHPMPQRRPMRRPHSFYTHAPQVPQQVGTEPFELDASSSAEQRTNAGPHIRARPTGRGPVVTQLIDQYDKTGQKVPQPTPDWESHARLWSQRRKSIGEGLRERAQRASTEPPEEMNMAIYDRYSGGLDYGYERGYGVGGSAGTRQLHSAASRKSLHYSHQFGVDLSDVPVFLQQSR